MIIFYYFTCLEATKLLSTQLIYFPTQVVKFSQTYSVQVQTYKSSIKDETQDHLSKLILHWKPGMDKVELQCSTANQGTENNVL